MWLFIPRDARSKSPHRYRPGGIYKITEMPNPHTVLFRGENGDWCGLKIRNSRGFIGSTTLIVLKSLNE